MRSEVANTDVHFEAETASRNPPKKGKRRFIPASKGAQQITTLKKSHDIIHALTSFFRDSSSKFFSSFKLLLILSRLRFSMIGLDDWNGTEKFISPRCLHLEGQKITHPRGTNTWRKPRFSTLDSGMRQQCYSLRKYHDCMKHAKIEVALFIANTRLSFGEPIM